MTHDDLEVLRDFRNGVSPPDEETRRRIYDYATGGAERLPDRHPWTGRLSLRGPYRLRVALALLVVGCAVGAGLAVPWASHGINKATQPRGKLIAVGGITADYTRAGQTLTSIAVTVNGLRVPGLAQVQVVRSDASTVGEAVTAGSQVVFQERILMTNTGATAPDLPHSTWSGTLNPADWSGGCQPGLYQVRAVMVPPGASLGNPSVLGSESAAADWFTCTGS